MRLCTECGRPYGDDDHGGRLDGLTISHGICPECAATWEAMMEAQMEESRRLREAAEKGEN